MSGDQHDAVILLWPEGEQLTDHLDWVAWPLHEVGHQLETVDAQLADPLPSLRSDQVVEGGELVALAERLHVNVLVGEDNSQGLLVGSQYNEGFMGGLDKPSQYLGQFDGILRQGSQQHFP